MLEACIGQVHLQQQKGGGVGWGGLDWIDLAQDRDRCWALVNAKMNRHVP